MTRRWKDNKTFIQQIRLFMIDEVHLLNDGTRGATVEAVISRMKLVISQLHNNSRQKLRIVAVSATMANIDDASFIYCLSLYLFFMPTSRNIFFIKGTSLGFGTQGWKQQK